jgi:hypothetical protein
MTTNECAICGNYVKHDWILCQCCGVNLDTTLGWRGTYHRTCKCTTCMNHPNYQSDLMQYQNFQSRYQNNYIPSPLRRMNSPIISRDEFEAILNDVMDDGASEQSHCLSDMPPLEVDDDAVSCADTLPYSDEELDGFPE